MQGDEREGVDGDPARCDACGGAHAPDVRCPDRDAETIAFGAPAAPAEAEPTLAEGDPLVGTRVGSFHVVKVLGRGGMGTVYLAEHPVIGSRVAVKFLHPHMAESPAVVARFFDEARAVNLIGHENIVGIYDLNQLPPNRYYFVMEYLEGETLTARLRAGRVPATIALDVLLQLCDALECAHDRGVVHRDLKPENVFLVSRRGKPHFVKLVDFGIAKLRDAASGPGRTAAGLIVGTPEYMAPEQCDDRGVDARTDVYALGVIAFELATGRLPFEGRTVTQLLLAHLHQAPPAPSSLAPGVEPALERAILRALEKDPAARFQSMSDLAAALREVQAAPAAAFPPAAAPPAAIVEPLTAEVRTDGGAPEALAVGELTRGGIFLRTEGPFPPLRARVRLALRHPSLRAPLELGAEVVRHVPPAEAARWRLPAGFAAELVDLTPDARAAIATLAEAAAGAAGASARAVPSPATDERLRALEARAKDSHYGFLGIAPDAEFSELRRAIRGLREELEGARERPGAADHPARALALLQRLDAAAAAISSPAPRLGYDARAGNWRGVARCVASGVPPALVEARRRELLAAEPGRRAAAERHLARAEVARKLGNEAAASAEYDRALEADPLDLATHARRRG